MGRERVEVEGVGGRVLGRTTKELSMALAPNILALPGPGNRKRLEEERGRGVWVGVAALFGYGVTIGWY